MDDRLAVDGASKLVESVPWGNGVWPDREEVDFVYPEDAIGRLTEGTVFVARIKQIDCDFYGIVGPYARFFYSDRDARFAYFLAGEPRDFRERPLERNDLLLPPWRIWYRAKSFSPRGFPFRRVDVPKVSPSAFFTSHPVVRVDTPEPRPHDWPLGDRPAPVSPNSMSDYSIAWKLVAAHWLRTEGPQPSQCS